MAVPAGVHDTTEIPGGAAARGYGRLRFDDPSVQEQLLRPWELVISPGEATPYHHAIEYYTAPGFSIYRETYHSSAQFRGHTAPGLLTFLVPLRTADRSTYWKHPLPRSGMALTMPTAVEARFGSGQSHYIGFVDPALLRRFLPERLQAEYANGVVETGVPDDEHADGSFAAWLGQLLRVAAHDSASLQHPSVQRTLEAQLAQQIARHLQTRIAPDSAPTLTARRRIIDRAMDCLLASDPPVISVPELCAAINVSQRTLEYAFAEVFDMTPVAYLRLHRLHLARRRLIGADGPTRSVTRIAQDLGFWHMPRFAAAYRARFGELPSATLARDDASLLPPLLNPAC